MKLAPSLWIRKAMLGLEKKRIAFLVEDSLVEGSRVEERGGHIEIAREQAVTARVPAEKLQEIAGKTRDRPFLRREETGDVSEAA